MFIAILKIAAGNFAWKVTGCFLKLHAMKHVTGFEEKLG